MHSTGLGICLRCFAAICALHRLGDKLLFIILEVFWLAVQGLVAPIAISSLVVLFTVSVVKIVIKAKGDDAMGSKVKEFVSVVFDILYTMSANLAGGALLAKTLRRMIIV